MVKAKEPVPDNAQNAYVKAKDMELANIAAALHIVCVMPVTSSKAERSYSRLQVLKGMLKSSMTAQRSVH